jgi:tol-pal system protein YbgF
MEGTTMSTRTCWRRAVAAAAALTLAALGSACVTTAEFRKLEYEVNRLKGAGPRGGSTQLADTAAELQGLRDQLASLEGRIEVAEHQAAEALEEAKAARQAAAGGGSGAGAAARNGGEAGEEHFVGSPEEVQAYREARAAWRSGDLEACIDRFRDFLQNYPASDHADDAAYWMADCHYREGDYKAAVLRFADVVQRYPAGDKAPDALYRQGEALLRLGPKYGSAAETAFERLIKDYPDSPRVAEARRQLELLGPTGARGGRGNEG